jgi:ABC-type Fe3+-hydroxamate transport system substrate-binding protein
MVPCVPQRLVSLVPSITETLYHFGWGAQLVGITNYCTEPATEVTSKPTIGGTKNPDLRAILALQPDLVFAVAEENRHPDIAWLEAAGIPVYVFEPQSVRAGIDLLWRVAELLDCRAEVAAQIQAIEQDYTDTIAKVARRPRVRVFCPIWKNPYMTINDHTYVHDILTTCGGDNIFAQRQRRFPLAADVGQVAEGSSARYTERDRRYPRISLDEMAALRPEVIVLPDEPYAFSAADFIDFLDYPEVPAVHNQRIYLIDGKMVSWYGPRIGQSLRALETLLAPMLDVNVG